ncbi:hydantoinase/oxoprolinase family protein [Microbacterium sp. No. 7]|uniref:hydantoinase/oxoprolinase family protein n=1 Tax=Microbacterium sp. No. 7 TaxID=1714373 RepID=UPI0006D190A1|nr:hydantoinase/oxoprolinase family protein [Microbacterium sp. No. 7]ALJ19282.1 5-oxoprolinase [Microbacterium sp. No. 7]
MIGVDVGGTFTDVVALRDGRIETAKVSTNYADVAESVIEGARALDPRRSTAFNHASTHGLNAVITRNLPKIGFLTTEGHRDILDMGRVWRPATAMLDPHWRRSFGDAARPLVPRYLRRGIRERIMASGEVLIELDEAQARAELEVLKRVGVEGVAICLLHGYHQPAHELRLRELVTEVLGDVPCSVSSEVSPLAKEYARASTTVIDVCMKIIYRDYTKRLDDGLRGAGFEGQLNFADCAATLVPVERAMEAPYRVVFSGPSAGTVASAHFGEIIGESKLLCADVGGTSCDISVVTDGQPFVKTTFELEHDLIVNALATDITAIGAGGGSIVSIGKSGEVLVGPGSAGSTPGPACYGNGGTQPTTTDTFIMIGIIDGDDFAGGQFTLDRELAKQAFEGLDSDFSLAQRVRYAFQVAVENIAEGLFSVAIKDGVDPRDYSLIAYGAAGPMLLPAALETIKCKEVIVPPHPGLFSALGLLSADRVYAASRSVYTVLSPDAAGTIDGVFAELERELREQIPEGANVTFQRTFDGHLVGQSWDTPFVDVPPGTIDADAVGAMIASFHDTYFQRAGNRFDAYPVQGVTFRLQAVLETEKVDYPLLETREAAGVPLRPLKATTLRYLGDIEDVGDVAALVYRRDDLRAGDEIVGPAIVREELSTTFVPADYRLIVGAHAELIIRKHGGA